MLHFNSYQSILVDKEKNDNKSINFKLSNYRVGWDTTSIRNKDKFYFSVFNEGLIESLVKFLWQKSSNNELFTKENVETDLCKKELEKTNNLRHINNNTNVYKISKTPGKEGSWNVESFSYFDERSAIVLLVDKILAKSSSISEKEVVQIMIRGMLNGNMLPFVKLIKKCFDQNAFRRIGEAQDGKELLEIVKSL